MLDVRREHLRLIRRDGIAQAAVDALPFAAFVVGDQVQMPDT